MKFKDYLIESKESREAMKRMNLDYIGWGHYKDKQNKIYNWDVKSKKMVESKYSEKFLKKIGKDNEVKRLKTVTYVIEKIGDKWIYGKEPGKSYLNKIKLNKITDKFEIGKTYTFKAEVVWDSSKYGSSVTVYPIPNQEIEQNKILEVKEEIEKWLNWVEEKAKTGWLYTNGIEKLKELNVKNYEDLSNRLEKAISTVNNIKQKRQEESEVIKKTEEQKPIKYLNVPYSEKDYAKSYGAKWDPNMKSWYIRGEVPDKLKKYDPIEIKKKDEQEGIVKIGGGSGYGYHEYSKGEIIKSTQEQINNGYPEFLYVIDSGKRYYSDDGMSFGVGDDSGYIYWAKCRPATKEESEPLRKEIEKNKRKKELSKRVENIKDEIMKNGERPEEEHIITGRVLFDTQNIYGGGDWFEITDNEIWYIKNNGMDGDNWANNNVRTGGAGAIGWKINKNEEIVKELESIEKEIKE